MSQCLIEGFKFFTSASETTEPQQTILQNDEEEMKQFQPELKAAFLKAYETLPKFDRHDPMYVWLEIIGEHFFMAGRESLQEEFDTWRSPEPKSRRIELHLTIKNESDSSTPVTLEQVYTI